jgi:ubiquinone/menaquinone biosynthesis C-methylase UbiE
MTNDLNPPLHSKVYRNVGKHGWHETDYFTFSVRSPILRRWIAAQIPSPGAEILSVGCGTGELENHLSAQHHRVVGLDLSHHMLQRAARNGLDMPVRADAQRLPFAAASFEWLLIPEAIGHLRLDDAFKEARRVLRKGGRVLVTTYAAHLEVHKHYRKFSLRDIAEALAGAGFRVAEQKYLDTKRNRVNEVPSEKEASLLYTLAARQD